MTVSSEGVNSSHAVHAGVSSLIELCRQYLVRHYSEYSSAALDLLPVGVARAIAAEHMRRANFQQLGIAVAPLRL